MLIKTEELIEDKSTTESNPLIERVQYDTDQHYLIQAKGLEIVSSIKMDNSYIDEKHYCFSDRYSKRALNNI